MTRGFSTLEILIAFTIMTLVFGGVMLADFSSNYWVIASQTSNEGLYKAKTRLEELRAVSKQDFYAASSSVAIKDMDDSCTSGSLCYYVQSKVTDISSCSKYVQAVSSWQVNGYPTTTTSLPTNLTNPTEAIALGGDCMLSPMAGVWSSITASSSVNVPGTPNGVDVLGGVAYVAESQTPYLSIYSGSLVSYTNSFAVSDPVNGIDVARDEATGRTYAYLAMASTTGQLAVVDVTDPATPVEVARVSLSGVDPLGLSPQGWRVFYYDQKVYVTTRYTGGNEVHVFDVSLPATPNELGSMNLDTSVYDMVVRDEKANGTMHRFAFLATTQGTPGKLIVLDVTDPAHMSEISGADTTLPVNARSIALAGHTIYVGTDSATSGGEIYAIDGSNILGATNGLPILASGEIGSSVIGLKQAGGYLYIESSTQAAPALSTLLDVDGNDVYVLKNTGRDLRVWNADPSAFSQISSRSLGSASLQLYESN